MRMRSTLLLFFLMGFALPASAQLTGRITDASGEPLPFASIYVQNTSTGTTSNVEGYYKLPLEPGLHKVVFQYVGFETMVVEVSMTPGPQTLDVALEEEAVLLNAVVVRPDAEDPAYGIIRKAIEKRRYYLELVSAYRCEVYIKGGIKLLDTPDKILGQEIGDLGGLIDTNTRRGILYLSESESQWNVQRPNKYKEIMVSSKVSGNSQGFSFNSAADVNFDFYENTTDYSRPIVSPIAWNALSFYQYELAGTIFDEAGRMIYKIKIWPKQPELPGYGGYIYIADELFNIQGVDVFVTGASLNQPALDTLFVRQVHVPMKKPDVWRLFSQTLTIRGNILGFRFGGDFTSMYRNYDLNPVFPKGFFSNEYFRVEEGANEKDLSHFDTIRPLPLTLEESIDYRKKDSIQVIRESKSYLDSLDRELNKFKQTSLLTGYTWQNSYKRKSITVESPASSFQFHTVHGFYGHLGLRYRKSFDRYGARKMETGLRAMYGFSEKRPRLSGDLVYQFNSTRFTRLRLSGGLEVSQFNPDNPISPTINSAYTLWVKRNYSKVYEKTFARADFRHELVNGILLETGLEYARRNPLVNTSSYDWNKKLERDYTPNNPSFPSHNAFLLDLNLRLRLKQQYISYPGMKIITQTKYPDLWIRYRGALAPGDARFHYLSLALEKESIRMGVAGQSGFFLQAGRFLQSDQAYFMDYRHFTGNQTIIGNPAEYRRRFFLLPYYDFSTLRPHAEAHWEHKFQGYLLDKIPGIRKLGLASVLSAKALWIEGQTPYYEAAFGIDQIGFGLFRFLRVDVAAAFKGDEFLNWGVVMGFMLPVNVN